MRETSGGGGCGGQAQDGPVIAAGNVFLKVYDAVLTHVPAPEMMMPSVPCVIKSSSFVISVCIVNCCSI